MGLALPAQVGAGRCLLHTTPPQATRNHGSPCLLHNPVLPADMSEREVLELFGELDAAGAGEVPATAVAERLLAALEGEGEGEEGAAE